MSLPQHIEITGKPPAISVKVDGRELLTCLSADLHVDAQSVPVLTVDLDAMVLDVDTYGRTKLSEHTREVLTAMGWTPPASDA